MISALWAGGGGGQLGASSLLGWERNPVVHSCARLSCAFLLSLPPLSIPQTLSHECFGSAQRLSFLQGPDSLT